MLTRVSENLRGDVQMAEVDQQKLEQFMGKMVTDMSAAMSGPLVTMGVKLGKWLVMALKN